MPLSMSTSKIEDDVERCGLLSDVVDDELEKPTPRRNLHRHISSIFWFCSGVVFTLFWVAAFALDRTRGYKPSYEIYSPVQHLVAYKPTTLVDDLFDRTLYMANSVDGLPSDVTDAKWKELYDEKMSSQISEVEAAKLDSTTLNIPNRPDQFLIELDVYHQLHCLNTIRKAIWLPEVERYRDDFHDFLSENGGRNFTGKNAKHIDHCLDWIRQALLCQPDITPVTWHVKRVAEGDKPLPMLPLRKNCVNMDTINDWARDHAVVVDFGDGIEKDS